MMEYAQSQSKNATVGDTTAGLQASTPMANLSNAIGSADDLVDRVVALANRLCGPDAPPNAQQPPKIPAVGDGAVFPALNAAADLLEQRISAGHQALNRILGQLS